MAHLLTLLGAKFNPAALPGLSIWLDAQDYGSLTFNSTTISGWADRSGKGNHAAQATAIAQPLYVASGINGKPALEGRHDGSNASQLSIADNASLDYASYSHFAVIQRKTDLNSSEHIGGKYTTTSNLREHRGYIESTDYATEVASPDGTSGGLSFVSVSTTLSLNTPYILSGRFEPGLTSARVNNGSPTTQSLPASIYNGSAGYELFSRNGGSRVEPFAGRIGEYLFFTRALNESERQAVLSYLSGKWGIAL